MNDRRDSTSSLPRPATAFPTHNSPRTWLLTSALSPLQIRLIRLLLAHGDSVVACLPPSEIEDDGRSAEFRELVNECKRGGKDREGWKDRLRGIRCDGRSMGQCMAVVAETVQAFKKIDILLCCKSEAVVGTVEELSTTPITRNLMRDQFETIFFSQVNFIKATLPLLRSQHNGHILVLTSIGGHIGTPGMPMYTAATWALEGFCDSLAYEIAPFNIKLTIVQPNKEIQTLTNRIVFAPPLAPYDASVNPAPRIRDMLTNLLNMNPATAVPPMHPRAPTTNGTNTPASVGTPVYPGTVDVQSLSMAEPEPELVARYPSIPAAAVDKLVMETVHALAAIGGHENPPARHIVGFEGAIAVKEKLKTVTEELEDFAGATMSVDIVATEAGADA